jgi:hypothetical protein
MVKANRQKLVLSELDLVEFWANWREASWAMGITPSQKRVDEFDQYMENAIANFEAESLYMAFEIADIEGWTRYVQEHPPSPEALAVLVILGLEQHRKEIGSKGGKSKGATNRQKIEDAITNRGDKTPKAVRHELAESGIPMSTIEKRTAGRLPKKPKT